MKFDLSNAAPNFKGYNVTSVEVGDYIAIKPSVWGSLEDMRWFRVEAIHYTNTDAEPNEELWSSDYINSSISDIITDSGTYGIEDVCDIRLPGEVQGLD